MGITVLGPFSGRPVKIRDQDVGRAVRDEENRIFYVLERTNGDGYYSAATRAGGQRDERRYDEMVAKQNRTRDTGAAIHESAVHDARGKKRASNRGKMVILILLLIVGALFYLFGPFSPVDWSSLQEGVETVPSNKVIIPPGSGQIPSDTEKDSDGDADNASSQLKSMDLLERMTIAAQEARGHPIDTRSTFIAAPDRDAPADVAPQNVDKASPDIITTSSGLKYYVEQKADREAEVAGPGTFAAVHYVMRIRRGRTLQDTWADNNGEPRWFIVGAGQVMAGLDEGVSGMTVGERRTLIVPRHLQRGIDDRLGRIPDDASIGIEVMLVHAAQGVTSEIIEKGMENARATVRRGDAITIDFVASVAEPGVTPFDSTAGRGKPMTFTVGSERVIPGFEAGVLGMAPGERRIMRIPHYLAYGKDGIDGLIPAKATLRYDVTLRKIERHGVTHEVGEE